MENYITFENLLKDLKTKGLDEESIINSLHKFMPEPEMPDWQRDMLKYIEYKFYQENADKNTQIT